MFTVLMVKWHQPEQCLFSHVFPIIPFQPDILPVLSFSLLVTLQLGRDFSLNRHALGRVSSGGIFTDKIKFFKKNYYSNETFLSLFFYLIQNKHSRGQNEEGIRKRSVTSPFWGDSLRYAMQLLRKSMVHETKKMQLTSGKRDRNSSDMADIYSIQKELKWFKTVPGIIKPLSH